MQRGVGLLAASFVDSDGLGGPGKSRSWEDLGVSGVRDLRWRHVSSTPYAGFGRLDGRLLRKEPG